MYSRELKKWFLTESDWELRIATCLTVVGVFLILVLCAGGTPLGIVFLFLSILMAIKGVMGPKNRNTLAWGGGIILADLLILRALM